MSVRLIKNSWWVDFRFENIRYRKRCPANSKAAAKAYEAVLRQRLVGGGGPVRETSPPKPSFKEFTERWFAEYVVPNNKYSEQRTKHYLLKGSLIPFFGKMAIGQIKTHHVELFKAQSLSKGATKKSVNNRLAVLSKCLKTAQDWLEIEEPLPKIKLLKTAPCRTDYLSRAECSALLHNASGIVWELALTALQTGMRQGEIKGLQWSSIDWEARMIRVRHSQCDRQKVLTTPKSNRERHIPLGTELYEVLFKRKQTDGYVFLDTDGKPFDYQRLDHRLTHVCEVAGVRRITWHVLRHTFASHLAMKGVPLPTIQALLGHSSISTTMRYTHVAPSTLRTAIDLLNLGEPANDGQPVGNQWLELQEREAA